MLEGVQRIVVHLKDLLLVLASAAIILLAVAYYTKAQDLQTAQHQIRNDIQTTARSERLLTAYAISAVQQNVDARYDDCKQLDLIRAGLRSSVQQAKLTAPLLYQLVPSLNTPEVHQIVTARDKAQLLEYAAVDCETYARRAIPNGDSHHYHVP